MSYEIFRNYNRSYDMSLCFFFRLCQKFRMILPFKSKLRDVILLIAIAGSCLYTACGQTQSGKLKSVFVQIFIIYTINVFILSKIITVIYIISLLRIMNVAYLSLKFTVKIHSQFGREFMLHSDLLAENSLNIFCPQRTRQQQIIVLQYKSQKLFLLAQGLFNIN